MIVLEHDGPTTIRHFHLNIVDHRSSLKNTSIFTFFKRITKTQASSSTYSSKVSHLPLKLQSIHDCVITQVEYNKVMLIGGMNGDNKPNRMLWQGSLGKNMKDLMVLHTCICRIWTIYTIGHYSRI